MHCGGDIPEYSGAIIPTVGAISINLGKANFRSVPFVPSSPTVLMRVSMLIIIAATIVMIVLHYTDTPYCTHYSHLLY